MERKEILAKSLARKAYQCDIERKDDLLTQSVTLIVKFKLSNRKFTNLMRVGKRVLSDEYPFDIEKHVRENARYNLANALLNNPNVTKPKGRLPN